MRLSKMAKTNQEIAKEIFQGKWGNDAERRRRLTEAGYNYEAIQTIVNAISHNMSKDEIAKACKDYDNKNGLVPFEIIGTEVMEIEIDLTKYKGINLIFTMGENNV